MNIWIIVILCFPIIWALHIIADTIYGIFYILNQNDKFDMNDTDNKKENNNTNNMNKEHNDLDHFCF